MKSSKKGEKKQNKENIDKDVDEFAERLANIFVMQIEEERKIKNEKNKSN